ncbi:MAG TPA: EAL domain-containing protein [Acetobacteraceae bacterium]|nr:EAL domain-containing protein [Acetobacteraceae bacterium]
MGLRSIRLTIAVGTVVILATIGGGSELLLERTKQTALHAAESRLQNIASVVENTINRQLLQVDSALVSLPPLFAATLEQTGEVNAQAAERLLKAFDFQTFAFRDLLLIRPDGSVWAAARPRPRNAPPPTFPVHPGSAPTPGAVAVEGPVRNALTGAWSWYLARAVTVQGVGQVQAIAEVPVPYLMSLLSPVGEIAGLRINLERPDGTLLASLPHDELRIGQRAAPAMSSLGQDGAPFLFPSKVVFTPTIGIWRHTLYPDVRVGLSLDVSSAIADWARDRDRLIGAAAVTAMLVLAFAGALYAAQRQRERVEMERKKSHDMLDSAIESMSDGFVMWDERDRLVVCNQRFREIYSLSGPFIRPGVTFEDIIRAGARIGQYPQAGEDIEAFVRDAVAWHRSNDGSLERLLPDGRWLLITERRTPTGCIVGIRTDITELRQALTDLAAANEQIKQAYAEIQRHNDMLVERDRVIRTQNMLFTAALNNMSQGLLMVDSDHRLIVCNDRFLEMFRISAVDAAPGTTTVTLFNAIRLNGALSSKSLASISQQQDTLSQAARSGAFVVTDGDDFALSISQRPMTDDGWVATYEDVTEQQRAQGRITFMAHYDTLTKLPNRGMFHTRLIEMLGEMHGGEDLLSLLYLDLDGFKHVNDTIGHPAGDAMLEAVARRLTGCARDSDVVARLGGDEFAIICRRPALYPEAAVTLAERVIERLSAPYQIDGRPAEIGASIGIATASDAAADADTLLRNADMALYQAKAEGRGTYRIFETEIEDRLRARLKVEADLRVALERTQLSIAYQPIFCLRTEQICGFEALLRWNHPTRGTVPPGLFIPLAEELRIIKPIGAWLIRQVCADIVHLPEWISIAVNLSPIQLDDDEIVGIINSALAEHGIDPGRLELEITESALLDKNYETVTLLRRLHDAGLNIALDDFGTGYSSLSYLRSFPFDKIKIDQLFVGEMATRADCSAIVASVVDLARKLGMTTTAEGVETEEQLRLVREASCETVQGYLFGRPQPFANAVERFGAAYSRATA